MTLHTIPISPLEAKRRELAAAKKANQYENFRLSLAPHSTKEYDDIFDECKRTARLVDQLEDQVMTLEEGERV